MANLAKLVAVPPRNSVNQGLNFLRPETMMDFFGRPGVGPGRGETCGRVTSPRLRGLLEKRNVARLQLPLQMPASVLDLVEEVFEEVRVAEPELFEKARTNGSLCVRPIGSSGKFSNHSWGCALDLGFGAQSGRFIAADKQGDGLTEVGLLMLVPFFNRKGFFWGGVFSNEDSMHFEVSDQLARHLFGSGPRPGGGSSIAVPTPRGGQTPNVKLLHPAFAADEELRQVAAGQRVLERSGVRRECVGLVQDALNGLGKRDFQIPLGREARFRGFFGPKTVAAVEAFQASAGLEVDGVMGEDTLEALDAAIIAKEGGGGLKHALLRSSPVLQAVAAGHLILERNSGSTNGVGELQDALNVLGEKKAALRVALGPNRRFRGFFGPQTEAAVKAFQKGARLPEDGRVGADTIKALDEALGKLGEIVPPTPIEAPGGYVPPESARPILGTVPLGEGRELEPDDFGITHSTIDVTLQLPGGVLFFEGGMQTDADGSPRAREIDRFGQLETAFNFPNQSGQRRFVDAEKVNYIVLPGNNPSAGDRFFNRLGFKLGDLAAVIHDGRLEFAMFADVGPRNKLGEGSVHLVQALGVDPFVNGQIRVGIADAVLYIVFPNSRPAGLTPGNVNQKIAAEGRKLFRELGGIVT